MSCRCASYKYDSVCKHSIAVAGKVRILEQHLKQITKASRIPRYGRRSSLVEANVNKNVAGKKGLKVSTHTGLHVQKHQNAPRPRNIRIMALEDTYITKSITMTILSCCASFLRTLKVADSARQISATEYVSFLTI